MKLTDSMKMGEDHFLSADDIQVIAARVGFAGKVELNEQWISLRSASDLARFFATCFRSYMQFLPDPTAQGAFSTAVVREYIKTIPNLDDYPRHSAGVCIRQRLVDALLR